MQLIMRLVKSKKEKYNKKDNLSPKDLKLSFSFFLLKRTKEKIIRLKELDLTYYLEFERKLFLDKHGFDIYHSIIFNFSKRFCQLVTFLSYNSLELALCLIGLIVLLKISLNPYGA